MSVLGPVRAIVRTFDEQAGHGTVVTDDGRELFFHCTQIADGTRTIRPGTVVRAEVRPGHRGRLEAFGLEPVG